MSNYEYIVRPGVQMDSPAINEMCIELYKYLGEANKLDATSSGQQIDGQVFNEQLAEKRIIVFVAQVIGCQTLIGFVAFAPNYSLLMGNGIEMTELFVAEKYRGTGVGRSLMASLASHAVDTNCDYIICSYPAYNKSSMSFFRRLGALDNDPNFNRVYSLILNGDKLKQLSDSNHKK